MKGFPKYDPRSDYECQEVKGSDLQGTDVLIGESGGISAIYEIGTSDVMWPLLCAETEHGPLYLDPDETYLILERL
jgi:hypothetical protein